MPALIVIIATFALCWFADKGFHKLFRSKPQHISGKAVHLGKFYSLGGLIFSVLGVFSVIVGISASVLLIVGGAVVFAVGVFLIVYYLSFGVYYDDDTFLVTGIGRKSGTYYYRDIEKQQLYNNRGNTLIELHMKDGTGVQLQSGMTNVYDFMDTAFSGWCTQRGIQRENCDFYDPDNSCWFPTVEV